MSAVSQTIYTEDKYLQLEERADYKSEYFRGEIFMTTGGTPNQYAVKDTNTITNSSVLIEIVSEGSGAFDRGDKFRLYRDIQSLQEYVLVNSINVGVEIYRRTEDNHWLLAENAYKLADSVTIQSIEGTLFLSDLYNGTDNV